MTAKQLESLLIDEALGELSEEASALLEAYLIHFPERQAEGEQVRRAVGLTETAVLSRPLAWEPASDPVALEFPMRKATFRIAALFALLGIATGAGYFAGKSDHDPRGFSNSLAEVKRSSAPSPWARYRIEENGRLAVIVPTEPKS